MARKELKSVISALFIFCSYEGPELEMWSLGVLLYTLLFSENPFCDVEEILDAKLNIPFPLSSGTLTFLSCCSLNSLNVLFCANTFCIESQTCKLCYLGCCSLTHLREWLLMSYCCRPGSVSPFHWQNTAGQRWCVQHKTPVSVINYSSQAEYDSK